MTAAQDDRNAKSLIHAWIENPDNHIFTPTACLHPASVWMTGILADPTLFVPQDMAADVTCTFGSFLTVAGSIGASPAP